MSAVGYWGIGLAAALGFTAGAALGAEGMWMGLAFGSIATAVGLGHHLRHGRARTRPAMQETFSMRP